MKTSKRSSEFMFTKVGPLSILGWLNVLIIQWLFIRLSYHCIVVDPDICEEARVDTFWDDKEQKFVAKTFYYYAITGCILPFTGWWGDYIMPFKFKLRLTKVKEYYDEDQK